MPFDPQIYPLGAYHWTHPLWNGKLSEGYQGTTAGPPIPGIAGRVLGLQYSGAEGSFSSYRLLNIFDLSFRKREAFLHAEQNQDAGLEGF